MLAAIVWPSVQEMSPSVKIRLVLEECVGQASETSSSCSLNSSA